MIFNGGGDRVDAMGTDLLILEPFCHPDGSVVYGRLDLDRVFHKYVSAWEKYPWPALEGWDLRLITIL